MKNYLTQSLLMQMKFDNFKFWHLQTECGPKNAMRFNFNENRQFLIKQR